MAVFRSRLCLLLTRELCRADPLETALEGIRGGVDCIQLREKNWTSRQLQEWGEELLAHIADHQVPLVVNDNLEVAMAIGAQGLHLGQEDMLLQDARRLAGDSLQIGISTHNLGQLEQAVNAQADYVGFGPIFPSETKGYSEGIGLAALIQARTATSLPILAIGGMTPENVSQIPSQIGLAVCAAICGSSDPKASANALLSGR